MATFNANPNEEIWIEKSISDDLGFRIWHVIFFCFSGIITFVILICCCVKIRIPRTKQEIEADYQRKKITWKFREKLKLIQNQDMDAIDLKRALEIIQEDLENEKKNIENQLLNKESINSEEISKASDGRMVAEPQQAVNGECTTLVKKENSPIAKVFDK